MSEPLTVKVDEYRPPRLRVGTNVKAIPKSVKIASGQDLKAGTVLGVNYKKVGTPVPDPGNTGDGVLDTGATSLGSKAIIGDYTFECIAAAANAGDFKVIDPNGNTLDAVLTVGVAYTSPQINTTIDDGANDFVVGDKIVLPVERETDEANLEWVKVDASLVDGSQDPDSILSEDCDATAAAVHAIAFDTGEFDEHTLDYGTGYTKGTMKPLLRQLNIQVKKVQQTTQLP